MSDNIRVIQYGLGPIGSATARLIDERGKLELVGNFSIRGQGQRRVFGLT